MAPKWVRGVVGGGRCKRLLGVELDLVGASCVAEESVRVASRPSVGESGSPGAPGMYRHVAADAEAVEQPGGEPSSVRVFHPSSMTFSERPAAAAGRRPAAESVW